MRGGRHPALEHLVSCIFDNEDILNLIQIFLLLADVVVVDPAAQVDVDDFVVVHPPRHLLVLSDLPLPLQQGPPRGHVLESASFDS